MSNGVPEECMGLCREKVESRSLDLVLPVDQCIEHTDIIRTCMVEEGKYIYLFMYTKLLTLS